MNRFSRTEFLLMNYLYNKNNGTGTQPRLLEMDLNLREKDEISKIRELVSYVEKLEREGFIETDPEFYTESDHMSFTYLNSAVELNEERIRLSHEGHQLIIDYMGSGAFARFRNAYKRIMEAPETRTVHLTLSFLMMLLGALLTFLAGRFF